MLGYNHNSQGFRSDPQILVGESFGEVISTSFKNTVNFAWAVGAVMQQYREHPDGTFFSWGNGKMSKSFKIKMA